MRPGVVAALLVPAALLAGCSGSGGPPSAGIVSPLPVRLASHRGIHRIKHVVVIMQENRSFDSYFGTFPGAEGLPTDGHGNFTSCIPDPRTGGCDHPYHNPNQVNAGALHNGGLGARGHQRRPDGRVRPDRGAARWARLRRDRADLRVERAARRHGLSRRARDPQLLALGARLHAPGPHVRAHRLLEPARASLHGLRVVRALHPRRRPDELRERQRARRLQDGPDHREAGRRRPRDERRRRASGA